MANRYFINGGVNNNWDTSGNWSATDGGAASGVKPTNSDTVFFTANSPNCTVNTAGVGQTINFTGYTNTITMTASLTISGSITLVAAMTIAGSALLAMIATGTLTTNGKAWPNTFSTSGTITITLADNFDLNGSYTTNGGIVMNGNTMNVAGGFAITASVNHTGTTNIIMDGTGTLNTAGASALKNNLTINTAGTITFGTAINYNTGTFTYTAGTVDVETNGGTFTVSIGTTLATNGMAFHNLTLTPAGTITFSGNATVNGLLTLGSASSATIVNGSEINCREDVRLGFTSGSVTGTTVLLITAEVVGESELDGPSVTTGRIELPIELDAPGALVGFSSKFTVTIDKLLITNVGTVNTDVGDWNIGGGTFAYGFVG